jgi:uncharacterized protein (TIGR03435 family)
MRSAVSRVSCSVRVLLLAVGCTSGLFMQTVFAQAPSTAMPPKFEVVVIRLAPPDATNWRIEFNPGTMRIQNRSIRDLIEFAYDLKSDRQLLDAPSWLTSQRFDIEGKEDEELGKTLETCPLEQRKQLMRQLVRSVLEERFKLQVTEKTAEVPVLALVVAKGGAKVEVTKSADGKTFRGLVGPAGKIDARGASMQLLADRLARTQEAGGRIVVDKTEMAGDYSWSLRWTPDAGLSGNPSDEGEAAPTLFTALQEQLGLKLESRKSEVPAVFIVHVEKPTEN